MELSGKINTPVAFPMESQFPLLTEQETGSASRARLDAAKNREPLALPEMAAWLLVCPARSISFYRLYYPDF
jgi:hypothetical protein